MTTAVVKRVSIFITIAMATFGCQTAKELHYFRSGDNYYRLNIKERSFASKARYLSGYFDQDAVDKYFSEMSQPKDSGIVWMECKDKNAQLVMILSTNSNSIAEQIGNLASNEELLENVAMLANKDKITASKTATAEMNELSSITTRIISAGDAYFTSPDVNNINQNIVDFLSNVQINSNGKLGFDSLQSAITKYPNR